MRIAFVSVPRFPCAVEVQRAPHLGEGSLIVGDAEAPKRVLDCSLTAAGLGVRPGIQIRKALALSPDAAILPPDPVLYRAKWEAILDALHSISPEVEDEELGRAYLNINGLGGHFQDENDLAAHLAAAVRASSGLEPSIGLANGRFPSFAAAIAAVSPIGLSLAGSGVSPAFKWKPTGSTPDPAKGNIQIVPAGDEAGFLAPLDVGLLPVDPEIVSRLLLFGLQTMGKVAALTLPELQSQFGFEGKRLWQLVNGIDEAPLRPRPIEERIEAALSFETPVAGIDVLVAAAKQLLSRLRLPLRGRAARELALQAELVSGRGWERRLVLREAVSDNKRLSFVLRESLQNAPPPNAVRNISLRLGGLTGETGKQLSLGERGRLQRQLEESIRQLKARYGYSPVFNCVDVEPWSTIPEQRQILVESDA